MRTVIFANGVMDTRPDLPDHDLLIAADGGAAYCRRFGVVPDWIVGDLDSLAAHELTELEAAGARVARFPVRKDFTDLELAVHHAVEHGAEEIVIFGALGARWDQTLANLLMPAARDLAGVRIRLVDGAQDIELIKPGERHEVHGKPGDLLSLVPLGGDAVGVITENLEYPLVRETLHFGSTRGISNRLLGENAAVAFSQGLLLCVVIHNDERAEY